MSRESAVRQARNAIDRDPDRRRRVDDLKRGMYQALALSELRKSLSITQEQLASLMGISQEGVSQIERRDEILLSTLRKYVDALGGRVEVTAVVGDRRIPLLTELDRKDSAAKHAATPRAT